MSVIIMSAPHVKHLIKGTSFSIYIRSAEKNIKQWLKNMYMYILSQINVQLCVISGPGGKLNWKWWSVLVLK